MADRVTLQADKAELPSKILLWRECQCHQDTNMGYTHRKSSVITAPKLPGAPVEFLGLATMVRIGLMYYLNMQAFFNQPDADLKIMLAHAAEAPPEEVEND